MVERLRRHLGDARAQHETELAAGPGDGPRPHRGQVPVGPANGDGGWVFLATQHSRERDTGRSLRRHQLHETVIQRAVRTAALDANITKAATPHTLSHGFATHLVERGQDIRTTQELLGHKNVATTMIYTHVPTAAQ